MKKQRGMFDKISLLSIGILLGFIASQIVSNTVIFRAEVIGSSMENTYSDGDTIYVYRLSSIDRGDIVAIDLGNELLLKRCVGMPGDTLNIEDGVVYINGKEYTEDYISSISNDNINIVYLSSDEYYVLGDNRKDSRDSRDFGKIRKSNIVGEVIGK